MNFTEFLQKDCGGYPIETILDNLTAEQIIEAVEEYAEFKKQENENFFTIEQMRKYASFCVQNCERETPPEEYANFIKKLKNENHK